jgi:hypothetical protein
MRVQGVGPPFASLAFITDLPEEWPALTPFLNGTDLPARDAVFLTTFMSPADWEDLELELNLTRPATIVTLGPEVTRAFLGDRDMENLYGHPYQVGCFVVFPAHAPIEEVEFACDLLRLSLYLYGQPTTPVTPITPVTPQTRRQPTLDL